MESTRGKEINRLYLSVAIGLLATGSQPGTAAAAQALALPTSYQAGDIVLRRGQGVISDIARQFSATDKRFSHVGILVKQAGAPYVAHAIHEQEKGYNGVVLEKLGTFLARADDWAIYRLRLPLNLQRKLAHTAYQYTKRNIPFDSKFDLNSSQAMYCTEFIWRVGNEVASPNPIRTASRGQTARYISIEDIYHLSDAILIEHMRAAKH